MIYYVYVVGMNELKSGHRVLNEGLPFHNRTYKYEHKIEIIHQILGERLCGP